MKILEIENVGGLVWAVLEDGSWFSIYGGATYKVVEQQPSGCVLYINDDDYNTRKSVSEVVAFLGRTRKVKEGSELCEEFIKKMEEL